MLAPIRDRLDVTSDMLAQYQAQLDRLLDLYLSGDFPKESLIERKTRLEMTVGELKKQQAVLAAQLHRQELDEQRIQTIKEFAEEIAKRLNEADGVFARKRSLIELLNVEATLVVKCQRSHMCTVFWMRSSCV